MLSRSDLSLSAMQMLSSPTPFYSCHNIQENHFILCWYGRVDVAHKNVVMTCFMLILIAFRSSINLFRILYAGHCSDCFQNKLLQVDFMILCLASKLSPLKKKAILDFSYFVSKPYLNLVLSESKD